ERYGLPVEASQEELNAAVDARIAASTRERYGLPVEASQEELNAAVDARIAASRLGGAALQ
ncbi:MAG: hypothetical protein JNK33_03140, partial [Candidatus Doudnabacteria bacterium]|nr:hypothetical protein [Candidatus Doudnabacteria bacterium]